MTAALMTIGDAYTLAGLLMLPALAIITIGMCIDRWPEWKAAHQERRAAYQQWLAYLQEDRGDWHYERGSRLGDPSPSPRHRFLPGGPVTTITDPDAIRALISAGIRQQDTRADALARAEGDQQR